MSSDDQHYSIELFKGTSPTFIEEADIEQPPLEKTSNHTQNSQGVFSDSEPQSKTDASISWTENFRSQTEVAAATAWQDRERPMFKFRKCTRSMPTKLLQAGVLNLELRLPTALINTVPARYRESGEEFTHSRCECLTIPNKISNAERLIPARYRSNLRSG